MATKPKLLCLHGRNSNKSVSEMQAIVLALDTVASCSFVDAPHLGEKYDKDLEGDGRTWIGADGDLRPSLEHVVEHCKKEGPFDGAYGFSQGCSILTVLSDPGVLKSLGVEKQFWSFVVCVCGSEVLVPMQTAPQVQAPIELPSFHMH